MLSVHLDEYELLDGSRRTLIKQVGDGSVIKRFELTPFPKTPEDIVCPHYLELKWATGCPFNCAWCYLKGTMRHYPVGKDFTPKPYSKTREHLMRLFRVTYPNELETLNSGETTDSLAGESLNLPFSKFVIPLFESQDRFKLIFLTKSNNVKNLLKINPHDRIIISFSLNAEPVAKRWEKAPSVSSRIEAAKKVSQAGYETRIRIDPIVPYPENDWQNYYKELVDRIFDNFTPERITLGSLRGLQTTINEAEDKSWVYYLGETSRWGKRIPSKLRQETFRVLIDYLGAKYDYTAIGLCKEPILIWESLGMDWRKCKCNCVW